MFISLGMTGPGDAGHFHDALFDESGPLAYHSAAHDAFGYMYTSHQEGPGYKYLGAASCFKTSNPLSEQVAGITFWKQVVKKHKKKTEARNKNEKVSGHADAKLEDISVIVF